MTRYRLRTVGLAAALTALIALSASWGFSRASAQGPAVSASSLNAQVGALAKVEVSALAMPAPGLGAWTIDIHYDPSLLTIVGCAATQDGICNPHYNATTLRFTSTNIAGLQGDTVLASIGLTCRVAGQGHLELSVSVLADATLGNPRPITAALQNGAVTCTSPGTPTPTPTPTYSAPQPTGTPPGSLPKLPGDADCNRIVNSIDAELILQYVANLIASVPCPSDADVNHDGIINAVDAELTLQMTAGLL